MSPELTENIEYVSTQKELKKVCKRLSSMKTIGVDFECENNLHHYGAYLTLIQISDSEKNYVVDVIELKQLDCLLDIFADSDIEKIFHDVSFDLRILQHQYDASVRNVTDTQMLALLNGEPNIGLESLLKKYFNVDKKSKFQKADWTKRPLSKEMLMYAAGDSSYLIRLKESLYEELKKKNRISWAEEECKHLESLDYTYKEQKPSNMKGYGKLSLVEKSIFTTVFNLREQLAKKVDMPPHFIINNKKLHEITTNPPKTVKEWRKMKRVHPMVKNYAGMFLKKVKKAEKSPVSGTKQERPKRYSKEQRELFKSLSEKRDELAEKYDLKKAVILSKDQMKDIVETDTYDSLREWQKDLTKNG